MENKPIPQESENPKGLNQRCIVQNVNGDPKAEHFLLRVDAFGPDIEHIKASRVALYAYAYTISPNSPQLAYDIFERYPLLSEGLTNQQMDSLRAGSEIPVILEIEAQEEKTAGEEVNPLDYDLWAAVEEALQCLPLESQMDDFATSLKNRGMIIIKLPTTI